MIVVEQVCNSIVKEIFLLPKFEMKNLIQVVRIKMTLLGRKFLKKKGRQAIGRHFFRMGASRPADNFVFHLTKT